MTPVLFRKDSDGDVTAVFPTIASDIAGHFVTCYAHIGQHGGCSREWYYSTKRADPAEYADLLAELRSIGYDRKQAVRNLADTVVVMVEQTLAEAMTRTSSPDFGAASVLCVCLKNVLQKLPVEERSNFTPAVAALLGMTLR
jgi:hypothetical protein